MNKIILSKPIFSVIQFGGSIASWLIFYNFSNTFITYNPLTATFAGAGIAIVYNIVLYCFVTPKKDNNE